MSILSGHSSALDREVALGLGLLRGVPQWSCATDLEEALGRCWCQHDVTPAPAVTATLQPCAGGSAGLGEVCQHES